MPEMHSLRWLLVATLLILAALKSVECAEFDKKTKDLLGVICKARQQLDSILGLIGLELETFWSDLQRGSYCTACDLLAKLLNIRRKLVWPEFSYEYYKSIGLKTTLCNALDAANVFSLKVCHGAFENYGVPLFAILRRTPNLRTICPILLQAYQCTGPTTPHWSIRIEKPRRKLRKRLTQDGVASREILQMTDVHFTPNYLAGSNAQCGDPVCCLSENGPPKEAQGAAGYWTDYRSCGIPKYFIRDLFGHVNRSVALDYIYFTGDIVDHQVWTGNRTANAEIMKEFWKLFGEYFGDRKVYPVLGNHDTFPCNLFPEVKDPEFNPQWLFNLTAELWADYLPPDAIASVRSGGYYTVSPEPGFRIIAINSNVAYYLNFWLYLHDKDPFGQLNWLATQLAKAEENNETVHILSHVPSGTEMYFKWAHELQRIIRRFSNIITGHFNGHTHVDEIVLYHSPSGDKPINVAFNGASVTSYDNLNSDFKTYTVTGDTFDVLDYSTYAINVTYANENPGQALKWVKLYNFISEYEVPDASPESVQKLLLNLVSNPAIRQRYFKNSVRYSDTKLSVGCDENCQRELVSNFVNTTPMNRTMSAKVLSLMVFEG